MAGTPLPDIPDCRDLVLVGERVGRTIYTSHDDRSGQPVGVIVYPPLTGAGARGRFDRAAGTAQRLGAHPSILGVHAWGVGGDGRPWVTTDPFAADDTGRLLTSHGPLEVDEALRIGILLAGAVESAHRAGVVHGDIAPARVVFGANGEPLLGETGLTPFASLSGLGALMAPIRYHSPPEVLEGTATSPATDVYGLASTVYALVAGRAPHEKPADITDSNASLLLRILQIRTPPIDRPGVPEGLGPVLSPALSPHADRRPRSALDLAWALQDVQRRAGLGATEPVVIDPDDLDQLARAHPVRTGMGPAGGPGTAGPPPAPDLWGPGDAKALGHPADTDDDPIFPGLVEPPAARRPAAEVPVAPVSHAGRPSPDPSPVGPAAEAVEPAWEWQAPPTPGEGSPPAGGVPTTLPAWFTDPLPNGPAPASLGNLGALDRGASVPGAAPGDDGSPWSAGWTLAPADPGAAVGGPPSEPVRNGQHVGERHDDAAAASATIERRPVLPALPQRRLRPSAAQPASGDPLLPGPAAEPPPRLPRRAGGPAATASAPARAPAGPAPSSAVGHAAAAAPPTADQHPVVGHSSGVPGSALARARQRRAERQHEATANAPGPTATDTVPAGPRSLRAPAAPSPSTPAPASPPATPAPAGVTRRPPRRTAPAGREAQPAAAGEVVRSRPPAVPIMVLIAVLVVLIAGAVWVIATGEEADPPASEASADQPSTTEPVGTGEGGSGAGLGE